MTGLTEAGQKVFDARYALKDEHGKIIETFEEAVYRLARATAGAERENQKQWEEKFANMMGDLLFVPSTPIWANMGKPDRPWQPSACFVLSVEDSLHSMYETLMSTAMIFKSGGGVGYNFSTIRPRGSLVRSTKGKASGVVELIKLYNASSDMVMQGGVRRGASMGILNIDHPEILDFINSKLNGGLTNFNLSVGVTNAFIEALEQGADWPLQFSGEVHEVLPTAALWEQIVKAAHACGDPGIIFLDTIQAYNPIPGKQLNCTNPCVTGETWVLTDEGPHMVKELLDRQFTTIINGKHYKTGLNGFFKTATKPVVALNTLEGHCLRLTSDHKVLRVMNRTRYILKYEWTPVSDLAPGDKIVLHNHRSLGKWPGALTEGEGYLLGLLVGDGTLKRDSAVLSVWQRETAVNDTGVNGSFSMMKTALDFAMELPHRRDFTGWSLIKDRNEYRLKLGYLKDLAQRMGLSPGNKRITPEIEKASSDGYAGFLRGFFDADGTVTGDQKKGVSIRLSQSNLEILHAVQRMLLRFGINSTVYKNRRQAGVKFMPDGKGSLKEYNIKTQHELVISNDNILVFAECVNFEDCEKNQKLQRLIKGYRRKVNRERFLATVTSVTEAGIEDVYDVQVPGANAFDANGIFAHNCGEQPLLPGESCLLGSINLARMVADNGLLNRDLLNDTVYHAVRFLDNQIDIAEYPLPMIAEATRATRKIGLGFTGLADALIKAGMPYDSAEGRKYAGEITALIQETASAASRELGEQRGCFPDWENSKFYPLEKRRNAACITIAPTGSVTTMAGCEGYGIEPIFAVAYKKSTNVAGDFEVFSPLFLKACREHGVSQAVLEEVARRGTCQDVVGLPEHIARVFKGAQDIAPKDHILMQAEVQKYVDNAVSKTINLPGSATADDIGQCYLTAFKLGLKGITVFRDGCKEGTVTIGKQDAAPGKKVLQRGDILPRPRSAHGMTHRLDTGCGKLYLTVNYQPDSGEILETFITTGSDGGCLVYTEATSRLISLAIRGGISIDEVAEQLQGTHSCPSYMLARGKGKNLSPGRSCASAIANKIAEIKAELDQQFHENNGQDQKVIDENLLCECGQVLERAEGCLICRSCGFSKC
ncbi:MAG: Ribonucleoside-diphosphate reductase NrdZ [Pelotomaculum sp. PtaB.Bin104]|nr:MAG: Ribonucleoside-diphosphate reductase NrdZ [Pelotomaculum sp. PtaB.Bin104]